jgi:hypothetical protein
MGSNLPIPFSNPLHLLHVPLSPLRTRLKPLLLIKTSTLRPPDIVVFHSRLPSRHSSQEHLLNILQRLPARLWEKEECMNCHGRAKDTEDDVDTPLDIYEGWRHEVGLCDVRLMIGKLQWGREGRE